MPYLFLDLMKITVVIESLSITKPNVLQRELFNYINVLSTEWEIYKKKKKKKTNMNIHSSNKYLQFHSNKQYNKQ